MSREEGKWGRSGRLHMVRRTGQLLDHWRAYFAADQRGRKNRKLSGRFSIPIPREHPLYFPSFFVSLRSPKSQTRAHIHEYQSVHVIIKYIRTYIHTYIRTREMQTPHFRVSQEPRSTRFRIFDKILSDEMSCRIPVSILSLFYFLFFFCFLFFITSFLPSNWKSLNCLNEKKEKKKKQSGICRIHRSIRFENSNERESENWGGRERERRDKDEEGTVTWNFVDSPGFTRFVIVINRGGY